MNGIRPAPWLTLHWLCAQQRLDVAVERDLCARAVPGFNSDGEPSRRHDHARGAQEARGQQLAARDRTPVVGVQDRLVQSVRAGKLLSDEHGG